MEGCTLFARAQHEQHAPHHPLLHIIFNARQTVPVVNCILTLLFDSERAAIAKSLCMAALLYGRTRGRRLWRCGNCDLFTVSGEALGLDRCRTVEQGGEGRRKGLVCDRWGMTCGCL